MSIRIITDSAADLEPEEFTQYSLELVPLTITVDQRIYTADTKFNKQDFFRLLEASNIFPTTSQPSPADFETIFEDAREKGDEIIYVSLSSALSGTFQCASVVKAMGEYDNVYLVDSLSATLGQKLLVLHGAWLRDRGFPAAEIAARLTNLRSRIRIYAGLDTLEYLQKGGRLSKAAAGIGALARIKPVITVNPQGGVAVAGKCLGKGKAMSQIASLLEAESPGHPVPGLRSLQQQPGQSGRSAKKDRQNRHGDCRRHVLFHWSRHWRPYRPWGLRRGVYGEVTSFKRKQSSPEDHASSGDCLFCDSKGHRLGQSEGDSVWRLLQGHIADSCAGPRHIGHPLYFIPILRRHGVRFHKDLSRLQGYLLGGRSQSRAGTLSLLIVLYRHDFGGIGPYCPGFLARVPQYTDDGLCLPHGNLLFFGKQPEPNVSRPRTSVMHVRRVIEHRTVVRPHKAAVPVKVQADHFIAIFSNIAQRIGHPPQRFSMNVRQSLGGDNLLVLLGAVVLHHPVFPGEKRFHRIGDTNRPPAKTAPHRCILGLRPPWPMPPSLRLPGTAPHRKPPPRSLPAYKEPAASKSDPS